MSIARVDTSSQLAAVKVPIGRRCDSIVSHLGEYMLVFENRVYDQMGDLCADYGGGFWDYVELTNGGFYMRLKRVEPMWITVKDGNGFNRELSPEAASIVANLFAYSHLASVYRDDRLVDHYWRLMEYTQTLGEFLEIRGAVD